MSLAFALMAAINGSTGSSATLAYGLKGTKPRRRQPGGGKILTAPRRRRKPPETLACKSTARRGKMPAQRFHACRGSTRSQPPPRAAQRPGEGRAYSSRVSSLRGGRRRPGPLSHNRLTAAQPKGDLLRTNSWVVKIWPSAIVVFSVSSTDLVVNRRVSGPTVADVVSDPGLSETPATPLLPT
jgi:hypothetical protein